MDSREDDEILALLAAGVPVREPSSELRERVMSMSAAQALVFIERAQGIWLPVLDAPVAIKELYCDSTDRLATRLVRLAAGVRLPPAALPGRRSFIVVAGRLRGDSEVLAAGDCAHVVDEDGPWAAMEPSLVLDFCSNTPRSPSPVIVHATDASWLPYGDGIRVRPLVPTTTGTALYEMQAEPNATLIEHEHAGVEELFVLRGSCTVEGRLMRVGDYHRAAEGSTHTTSQTESEGCDLICSLRAFR